MFARGVFQRARPADFQIVFKSKRLVARRGESSQAKSLGLGLLSGRGEGGSSVNCIGH